jgi:EAL domain-containing protein (putative c-di-GMP-specific phosphodiesterase class I)/CheY-like chemotaxis protein
MPAPREDQLTVPPVGDRIRVLLVEDEPLVCRAYARVLGQAGFEVTTALDAEAALRSLHETEPNCMVSDIAMPGTDGVELLRRVRETDVDLPVILVTGFPDVQSAVKAVEYGAFRYLQKPVDFDELVAAVGKAARMHRMARLRREAYHYLRRIGLPVGDRAGLEAHFQNALGRLWMAFQPIVDWSGRRVVAYEALVRSEDEILPHPGALLDAAERLERLDDLGLTIRRAVSEVVHAAPDGVDFYVNLHSRDLMDDALFSRTAPLSTVAERVVLEITERASLDGIDDVRQRVARLRGLGYRIAVDDLGAGYAGLNSFAQLEPEVVKLDMALTRDVHVEPIKRALVESITGICQQMNVTVVAEGVESEAERDTLDEAGCRLFQGYLFAKPARGLPPVTGCELRRAH